jgi:hypothetical protein
LGRYRHLTGQLVRALRLPHNLFGWGGRWHCIFLPSRSNETTKPGLKTPQSFESPSPLRSSLQLRLPQIAALTLLSLLPYIFYIGLLPKSVLHCTACLSFVGKISPHHSCPTCSEIVQHSRSCGQWLNRHHHGLSQPRLRQPPYQLLGRSLRTRGMPLHLHPPSHLHRKFLSTNQPTDGSVSQPSYKTLTQLWQQTDPRSPQPGFQRRSQRPKPCTTSR